MEQNKQIMIFLAGELRSKVGLLRKMNEHDFDYYAADSGYFLAEQVKAPLKKLLGDFDSAPKPNREGVLLFPSEKDEPDSELALDLAIKDGYNEIWLIAPFGGRLDHTVANLGLLEKGLQSQVDLKLYDGENTVFLLTEGKHTLSPACRYISFFSWTDTAAVSLTGFKYPLDYYELKRHQALGLSNEPICESPVIEVHNGTVLCICIEDHQEEV